jgi:hypothetical protein
MHVYRIRTSCTARKLDLTLEDSEKKEITLIDMACQNESNKNGNERRR